MIMLADSEVPDQTARMRRLIWAFAVRSNPKIFFGMARWTTFATWRGVKMKVRQYPLKSRSAYSFLHSDKGLRSPLSESLNKEQYT